MHLEIISKSQFSLTFSGGTEVEHLLEMDYTYKILEFSIRLFSNPQH